MGNKKQGGNNGQQQKKDKNAKGSAAGRNKGKCAHYMSYDHQDEVTERTLARVLKSSGPTAAKEWAEQYGAVRILDKLTHNKSEFGGPSKIAELAKQALSQ